MAAGKTFHKILIVDDSKADRRLYRRSLEQDIYRGYSIHEAAYAEQGIALCQQDCFDAILLDFQLPDMDGLQVLDVIKSQHPQTAVIMLTGHGSEQIAVQAMKRGAYDYLIKDQLSQDVLLRTVRSVINQMQLQRQLQSTQQQRKVINQLALNIRGSLVLEETLKTTVEEVQQQLTCDRVLVYRFAPDMSGTIIAEAVHTSCREALGTTVRDSYFQDQGTEEYCQGRIQRVDDVYRANLDPCHLELLEQFDVKAILVTPILLQQPNVGSPELWGLLVAHHCTCGRVWLEDEVMLLEALSVHIAIAIQHAQLLEKTQIALEQAQSLSAFKSKILTTISHEYNNPLTAIQTAAETLRIHATSLTLKHRKRYLAIIEHKAKHLSTLVRDMLLANQAELDKLELCLVDINLDTLLSKLIAESQSVGEQKQTISLKTSGDLDNFKGDLGLLQQIFNNLLSNAIKYSPDDGNIQLIVIGEPQRITIHVHDNGIGIPEKDQPYLFEVFRRGSNVGTTSGTGLGLNIVKSAVELHGGSISITTKLDNGTHIKVELPKTNALACKD